MLFVLSALIGRSKLRFLATGDFDTSWLAVGCVLHFDSPLSTTEYLQATASVSSSWDGPVYSAATFSASVWSQFKLDLKERETTNEIKLELEQEQGAEGAAKFLPNESQATANVQM